jgi:hypothetical protein
MVDFLSLGFVTFAGSYPSYTTNFLQTDSNAAAVRLDDLLPIWFVPI